VATAERRWSDSGDFQYGQWRCQRVRACPRDLRGIAIASVGGNATRAAGASSRPEAPLPNRTLVLDWGPPSRGPSSFLRPYHSSVARATAATQAKVSLLRWLRRQLAQPTAAREHLEAAVVNDDPAEARRVLARFGFSAAQRRHIDGLIDVWEREVAAPGRGSRRGSGGSSSPGTARTGGTSPPA
jgi:hypothetical protein